MSSETSEVGSFLWSMAWEKILTIDNLVRRGMVMVNWWCVVCKNSDDNVDHLLLHYCSVAMDLWNSIFVAFGARWVMPEMVKGVQCCSLRW